MLDRTETIVFGSVIVGGLFLYFINQPSKEEQEAGGGGPLFPDMQLNTTFDVAEKRIRQYREELDQIDYMYKALMGDFDFNEARSKGYVPRSPPVDDRAMAMNVQLHALRDKVEREEGAMSSDPSGVIDDTLSRIDYLVASVKEILDIGDKRPEQTTIIYNQNHLSNVLYQEDKRKFQQNFNQETKQVVIQSGGFNFARDTDTEMFQREHIEGSPQNTVAMGGRNTSAFMAIESTPDIVEIDNDADSLAVINVPNAPANMPSGEMPEMPADRKVPEIRPAKRKPALIEQNFNQEGTKKESEPAAPHPPQPSIKASTVRAMVPAQGGQVSFNPANDVAAPDEDQESTKRRAEDIVVLREDDDPIRKETYKTIEDRERVENALVIGGAQLPEVTENIKRIMLLKIRFDKLVGNPDTTKQTAEQAYRDIMNDHNMLWYGLQSGRYNPKKGDPSRSDMMKRADYMLWSKIHNESKDRNNRFQSKRNSKEAGMPNLGGDRPAKRAAKSRKEFNEPSGDPGKPSGFSN